MRKRLAGIGVVLLGLSSCTSNNPLDVDVSHIEADVEIVRLEQKMFGASYTGLIELNYQFQEEYPDLWNAYFQAMLKAGSPEDSLAPVMLDRFINDDVMQEVYADIQKEFPDLNWLEKEIEEAFRHLIYYYPGAFIPKIVTYNSVFNYGVATFEKTIGIGLDMYLGPENEIVQKLPSKEIPQFVKNKMRKEYIIVDVMRGWFEAMYMKEPAEKDFLAAIIYEGKILYALDALLPGTPDHVKIRYTPEEYDWCTDNEKNIWKDIVDRKLLYSSNENEIHKFIADAPFTSGMPQSSPARIGSWLGWQMVRSYMEENAELELPDVISEQNARTILKSYKPEK